MNHTVSKNQVNFYTASESDENQRLDNLLAKVLKGVPKSYIYRIIRSGEVRVNKKRQEASYKVAIGDILRIPPVSVKTQVEVEKFIPKSVFPILFEDDYFLIINKPDGVACHGGSGISFGVIEQLRQNYPEYKFLELAHRLDRDTSGILILAKKRSALVGLQALMRAGKVRKHYLAMTNGVWSKPQQSVKAALTAYVTKDGERRVRVDAEDGQFSHTDFRVIQRYTGHDGEYTLVEAILHTGRTHQIRVHLQHLGHAILGDSKYGDFERNKDLVKYGLKRMFLHASFMEFIHPITEEKLQVKCELPPNLQKFVDYLDH